MTTPPSPEQLAQMYSPEQLQAIAGQAPANGQDFANNPNYQQLAPYASQVEQQYNLPAGLLVNTAGAESSWNPNAVNSQTGATGLMQFEPATAKQFDINPTNPYQSLEAAGKYYRELINRNGGNVKAAIAEYGGFKTQDPTPYINKVLPQGYQPQQQQPQQLTPEQIAQHYTPEQLQAIANGASPEPGLSIDQIAQHYTPEQLQAIANGQQPQQSPQQQMGEFNKGVHRSIANTANLMMNALPALGKGMANELFGTHFDTQKDLEDYANRETAIEKEYNAKVTSFSDIHSASDIMPYLAGQLGENIASIVPLLGEGYIGAKLMTPALSDMADAAAEKYFTQNVGKYATEEEASIAARKAAQDEITAKAATLSTMMAMIPQSAAGEYATLMSKGKNDPFGAAVIGSLEAGIFALPEMQIVKYLFKDPEAPVEAVTQKIVDDTGAETKTPEVQAKVNKWKQRVADTVNHPAVKNMLKDAGFMGATGMASQAIGVLGEGILGANPHMLSADNFVSIINAGMSSAIGGGMMGAGIGAIQGMEPRVNPEEGEQRTEAIGGKAEKKTAEKQPKGQTEVPLATKTGVPLEQANPPTTNLTDPSILRPAAMTDSMHTLADRYGLTVEDLHKIANPADTQEQQQANLQKYFDAISTPPVGEEPLPLPPNPEDAANAKAGTKVNQDGTITREVTPESLKKQKVFKEDPTAAVGVHSAKGALQAVNDYIAKLRAPEESLFRSRLHQGLSTEGQATLWRADTLDYTPPTVDDKLTKTAQENGIPVSKKTTPEDIIQGLRAKQAYAEATKPTETNLQRGKISKALAERIKDVVVSNKDFINANQGIYRELAHTQQDPDLINSINDLLGSKGESSTLADNLKKSRGIEKNPYYRDLLSKAYDKASQDFPYLQRTDVRQTPFEGNALSDIATPIRVAKDLSYIPLTDKSKELFNTLIGHMQRIVKEVGGDAVRFEAASHLFHDEYSEPILGAQFRHLIMVVFPEHWKILNSGNFTTIMRQAGETAYHEAAHFVYNTAFTDREKQIIRENAHKLKPYFMQDSFLSQDDFDLWCASERGLNELWANAVGKEGIKRLLKEQDQMKNIPLPLRALTKKAMDFFDKLRAVVRGTQTDPFDQLMTSTIEGKFASDHINDAMRHIQYERNHSLATHLQRANGEQDANALDEALDNASSGYNGLDKINKGINENNGARDTNPKSLGLTARYLESFRNLADRYDFITPMYNLYKEALRNGGQFLAGMQEHLNSGFLKLNKADRYLTCDIMDAVSKAEGKIKFDKMGNAHFTYHDQHMNELPLAGGLKDGDEVVIHDEGINKGLKSLQNSFKYVLDQREQAWRQTMANAFAEEGLKPNFTKNDLTAVRNALDPDAKNYDDSINRLDIASEELDGLARMRKYEYIPRQRYGKNAYFVHYRDTKENQEAGVAKKIVAMHTVEAGFFNREFDGKSLAKAQAALKPYLDHPELYKVSDAHGRIAVDPKTKELKRPIGPPKRLTYDILNQSLSVHANNLELLGGLLNSRAIDMDQFNELRDRVTTQAGRHRMFRPSEAIDGYSKDWDRVIHSYGTGAAHYLGMLEFNRQLPAFQRSFEDIENPIIRERLKKHFGSITKDKDGNDVIGRGYVNSGKSDWSKTRMVNYLYCMGGNLSSLLVETLKLPTVTLGNMSQYDMNVLRNMNRIRENGTRYVTAIGKVWKHRDEFGGNVTVPLDNEDFLRHITGGDKEKMDFLKKVAHYNNIAEASSTRSFAGGDAFGSETGMSGFNSKWNKIQTFLSNPLATVEQGARLVSFLSTYDAMKHMEETQPGKLDQILSTNEIYKDLRERNPDWKPWQAGAMYSVDEENGAPGKIDRAPYLQGFTGAFTIPFFTFDQAALESIIKMYHRGPEGKKALGVMMGAFAFTAGLMGLPGARLLIKGGQAIQNDIEGTDYDWEQAIRQGAAPYIGARNAMMLTNGVLRAYGGTAISQRISLPLPGEDILMNLLGVDSGKTTDVLGVEGSIIQNASNAWRSYMNGQSATASLSDMMPNAMGNLFRAYELTQRGAMNNLGGNATRALRPDQLSDWSVISRAIGMTSSQIANANEQIYQEKIRSKALTVADHRFTQQAAMALMEQLDAQRAGNSSKAAEANAQLQQALQAKAQFAKENGIPLNMNSFMKQLMEITIQRQMPLQPTNESLGGKTGKFLGSMGIYRYFTNLRNQ